MQGTLIVGVFSQCAHSKPPEQMYVTAGMLKLHIS